MKHPYPLAILLGAITIAACRSAPEVVQPSCSSPASLDGQYSRKAPGYLISVDDGVTDTEATVRQLASKYSFKPDSILGSVRIFTVRELTAESLAGLRCEPAIRGISFNEPTRIATERSNKRFESARTARPTRKGDAPLLAPQARRWAADKEGTLR